LRTLENNDQLESKQIGGRNTVWWLSDSQEGHSTGVERSEPVADESPEPTPEATENEQQPRERGSAIDDALEGWNPGKGPADTKQRREIGRQSLEWLRDQSTKVQKADFVHALYEQTSLEGQGEKSWWERVVRPGLNHAADRGCVNNAGRSYEWVNQE